MTTQMTDLSSSLSGALDSLLGSLREALPITVFSLTASEEDSSEWYYDINKKSMVRVPNGTEVIEHPKYSKDKKGRIVVQTVNNDLIRVDPSRIFKTGFH